MLYAGLTQNSLEQLAVDIAASLTTPCCVLLYGDLGAGKSTFARKAIQSLTTPKTKVPSPTFTLLQTYDTVKGPLAHFDLYRVKHMEEVHELGWEDYLETHICFIEWPERLGTFLPQRYIKVEMIEVSENTRDVTLEKVGYP